MKTFQMPSLDSVLLSVGIGDEITFRDRSGKAVRYTNEGLGYWKQVGGDAQTIGADQIIDMMQETVTVSMTPTGGRERHLFFIQRK